MSLDSWLIGKVMSFDSWLIGNVMSLDSVAAAALPRFCSVCSLVQGNGTYEDRG